jgi:hypothetical protein
MRAGEGKMTVTLRHYLFADDGLHRLSKRVLEGLINGTDALPQHAGTKQRTVEVMLKNDDGFPVEILETRGSYLEFDGGGKIDRRDLALVAFEALRTHDAVKESRRSEKTVVDLGPSIERQQWERENRWKLSKDDLDMIAADIWGTLPEGAKRKIVKGVAPKPPPLSSSARYALAEIDAKIALIDFELGRLSEVSLKAVVFRAKQKARSGRDKVIWNGVAALADYYCDLQARHRRGNGKWFAVIEARTSFPEEERSSVECVAFKECNSKREAEEAARLLLADNAKHFTQSTSIEAKLYCDLQWSPDDEPVYIWPVVELKTDKEEIDEEEA